MPSDAPDAVLVHTYLKGDEQAFAEICTRYAALVHAVAFRATGSRDLAEEATQATFVTAATRLSGLREPDKLRSWLCAVCRAEVSHMLRRLSRDRRRAERVAQLREVSRDEFGEDSAYAAGLLETARAALNESDQVLLGLVLADLSSSELASALGVDIGTADTRKSRLYDRLRLALEAKWLTRPGRPECAELEALLARRHDSGLSRTLSHAIDRHCKSCDTCAEERSRLEPFGLLGAAPLPPLTAEFLGRLPQIARSPRLSHGTSEIRWAENGFPRPRGAHQGPSFLRIGATAASLVLVAGVATLAVHLSGARTDSSSSLHRVAPTTAIERSTTASSTSIASSPVSTPTTAPTSSASTTTSAPTAIPASTTSPHSAPQIAASAKGKPHHPAKSSVTSTLPVVATTTTTTTTTAPTPTTLAPGQLVLSSNTLNLGTAGTTTTIVLSDPGAPLSWNVQTNVSWLSFSANSGTVSVNAPVTMTISMARASAPTGQLMAEIVFGANTLTASVELSATELGQPTITSTNVPNPIDCSGTLAATVSAPAGVQSVTLSWQLPGSSTPTVSEMTLADGSYAAPVGPFASNVSGQATWTIVVTDQDGKTNATPSTGTTFVSGRGCSG